MAIKFFKKSHDGGKDSGVTGYWLIEWKAGFSIVLLKFSKGSREAFHNHAFNALTLWLKGRVREEFRDGSAPKEWRAGCAKYTKRGNFHKIIGITPAWALSIRGPWHKTWEEEKGGKRYTLTHGRKIVNNEPGTAEVTCKPKKNHELFNTLRAFEELYGEELAQYVDKCKRMGWTIDATMIEHFQKNNSQYYPQLERLKKAIVDIEMNKAEIDMLIEAKNRQ